MPPQAQTPRGGGSETPEQFSTIRDVKGDEISTGRYPVVNVGKAWEP